MSKNSKSIHGLPSQSYTDQQFWEIECNTVLADGWLFVGFVHEFLKPGDVIPISIAGKPILLIKNSKDEIIAFFRIFVPPPGAKAWGVAPSARARVVYWF